MIRLYRFLEYYLHLYNETDFIMFNDRAGNVYH